MKITMKNCKTENYIKTHNVYEPFNIGINLHNLDKYAKKKKINPSKLTSEDIKKIKEMA